MKKNYKNKRNENYFNHYKSIYSLIRHAKKLLKDKNLEFSREDFKIIIYNTIVIKLSDRIHNLNDIAEAWSNNPSKIEKKLLETEKYLLDLAKEFNIETYDFIVNEISRIRTIIAKNNTIEKVKKIIE